MSRQSSSSRFPWLAVPFVIHCAVSLAYPSVLGASSRANRDETASGKDVRKTRITLGRYQ
jgi:hypothetical protein